MKNVPCAAILLVICAMSLSASAVSPLRYGCPADYTYTNNRCEKRIQIDSTCPEGHTYSAGQCYKKVRMLPTCRSGFVLEGTRCIYRSVVEPNCPSGFKYENQICRRTTTMCPIGQVLRNGACIMFEDDANSID